VERWHIEEVETEDGFTWNILEKQENSHLICIAQCLDEVRAGQIISALKWVDAMGGTRMSLAMEGIRFDARTGKAKQKPLQIEVELSSKRSRK